MFPELEPERHMPYDTNDFEANQAAPYDLEGFTFFEDHDEDPEPAPE
jgi:hypothetical protein